MIITTGIELSGKQKQFIVIDSELRAEQIHTLTKAQSYNEGFLHERRVTTGIFTLAENIFPVYFPGILEPEC